jgi:RNA-directed DNA polymerase
METRLRWLRRLHKLVCEGYTDVVDADLKYFDTIPHSELMQCVARRIVDRDMLHLIKMWLKVPLRSGMYTGNRGLAVERAAPVEHRRAELSAPCSPTCI